MALGYEGNGREGQQKAIVEKPSADADVSSSTEPHQTPEPVNNHPEQGATGVNPPSRTITPIRQAAVVPPAIDNLSSSPSSDWEFVQLHDALPSLTSAPSVETAVQSKDPSEEEEELCDLTQSTLLRFNENNEHIGAKASMEAKKGTATRASDDSDEPLGSYAPADGESDPLLFAAGSWTDDIPRNEVGIEDEFARL